MICLLQTYLNQIIVDGNEKKIKSILIKINFEENLQEIRNEKNI